MDKYKDEDIETISKHHWQLLTTSFYPNKDLIKLKELVDLFKKKSADIIALVEIGGKESLENLNSFFLEDQYDVYHFESNSDRGIDLGYLVKKNLPFVIQFDHHNHKKLRNGNRFSRGLLKLRIKSKSQDAVLNLCHLKSKLNKSGKDFEGRSQRSAEVDYMVKDALKYKAREPKTKLAYLGDFNGIIYKDETEEELKPFANNANLIDVLERTNKPLNQRISYCYFDRQENCNKMQLDYALVNEQMAKAIVPQNTYICGFDGQADPLLPKSRAQKFKLPSDHFPLYFEFELS